eukprot:2452116-Rhodomonas_salina.1
MPMREAESFVTIRSPSVKRKERKTCRRKRAEQSTSDDGCSDFGGEIPREPAGPDEAEEEAEAQR